MKPPYDITPQILKFVIQIAEKLGEIKATHLHSPTPQLRKQNRIRTIQASLEIEGNTLGLEQVTAIFENKKVIGPQREIQEVKNAIQAYAKIEKYDPYSLKDFLNAHKILMTELLDNPGKIRNKVVGIKKGNQIAHIAPPGDQVYPLLKQLFAYLKENDDSILIRSCVFHYEVEFIHPFLDGNGRLGRLWQTVLLHSQYPVFEYLPFESMIKQYQQEYYKALSSADNIGKSTPFIEFMLNILDQELASLLQLPTPANTPESRLREAHTIFKRDFFSRKDYLLLFKEISTATASRDIKWGVTQGLLRKTGEKALSKYQFTGKKQK